jgi:hypothetical protein
MANSNIVPIVTSVNMDDYLSVTIANNRPLFEEYYVLTAEGEESTRELCHKHGARCIEYDGFFGDPECPFRKSPALRHAQQIVHGVHKDKWMLLLDTDTLLPKEISSLDPTGFNRRALYGMRRMEAHSYDQYKSNELQEYHFNFMGYFQMYFKKDALYDKEGHVGKDMEFWGNFNRRIIVEGMHVIHIGRRQMHWEGRNEKRLQWGPQTRS